MIANPKIVTISMISCVGRTVFVYYLLLAVSVFYSLFVKISTIRCVGRTVIYLSIIYFSCHGLLLGICRDLYD